MKKLQLQFLTLLLIGCLFSVQGQRIHVIGSSDDNGQTIVMPVVFKLPIAYSGVTDASGNYTYVFPVPYSVAPTIQANYVGTNLDIRTTPTAISTTGFTVNAFTSVTNTLLGIVSLTSTKAAAVGVTIQVTILEK